MKRLILLLLFLPFVLISQDVDISDGNRTFSTNIEADTITTHGGWRDYTPTITYNGGTVVNVTTTARYSVINKTVTFDLTTYGTNNGTNITGFTVSLPITSKSIAGLYPDCSCQYDNNSLQPGNTFALLVYLNTESSAILNITAISIGTNQYIFMFSGSYEIN